MTDDVLSKPFRVRVSHMGLSNSDRFFEVTHHPAGSSDFEKAWSSSSGHAEQILLHLRLAGWMLHEVEKTHPGAIPDGFVGAIAVRSPQT